MKISFAYNIRNLWRRRLTTTLTVGGIALVVFAFTSVLMLAHGLEKTLVTTGSDSNMIVLRKGAETELMSWISRETVSTVKSLHGITRTPDGGSLISPELVVIINLTKKDSRDMGNVTLRGTSREVLLLRPQVVLVEGRMFESGTAEIIVGRSISERFENCSVGSTLRFGAKDWNIVGLFKVDGNGFESEIWGDVEQLLPAFNRPVFSSMTLRVDSPGDIHDLNTQFDTDLRLKQLTIKPEREYYEDQSVFMATFIRILGLVITITFSLGSTIGAMITMYTAVANRTKEIGTLRALGFGRRSIMHAFLLESLLISVIGGLLGIILAAFLQLISISTTNYGTFSELAFGFQLSPSIVLSSMLFAVAMGIAGGFLPALRASRLQIVVALRST